MNVAIHLAPTALTPAAAAALESLPTMGFRLDSYTAARTA